jgi:hypothetical protein
MNTQLLAFAIGIIFLIALVLALSHKEPKIEFKVKALTEPEINYKSGLDPFVPEDFIKAKAKRKYKPRKVKVKALEENHIDKNTIITVKKIKNNKV